MCSSDLCGDCAGVLTELRLYAEQPSGRAARYELTETYLGALDGRGSIATTGRWASLPGSAGDGDATRVQLDLGRVGAVKNFGRIGDDELRMLDRNRREILSNVSHSLHRVLDLPAATLLESDSGRTIEVERGQRVFVVLGANRGTGYDWALEAPRPGPLTSLGSPVYVRGPGAYGAAGAAMWFFRASGIGKQELLFQYRRPTERITPPVKTVSYTVSVR